MYSTPLAGTGVLKTDLFISIPQYWITPSIIRSHQDHTTDANCPERERLGKGLPLLGQKCRKIPVENAKKLT
jgi:hypothetical protein